MTLTTAQQVRLKIQDPPTVVDETFYADGKASAFQLSNTVHTSASALVLDGGGQWSATGGTFASGTVTFSAVLSANSGFRVRYVTTVFSDDEIGNFTAIGGTVNGAALEALQALMFDAAKRARWSAPDGTEYDDRQTQVHLRELWKLLKDTEQESATLSGGFQSWSLGQEDYP